MSIRAKPDAHMIARIFTTEAAPTFSAVFVITGFITASTAGSPLSIAGADDFTMFSGTVFALGTRLRADSGGERQYQTQRDKTPKDAHRPFRDLFEDQPQNDYRRRDVRRGYTDVQKPYKV